MGIDKHLFTEHDRFRQYYIAETRPLSLLWVTGAVDGHNYVSTVDSNIIAIEKLFFRLLFSVYCG